MNSLLLRMALLLLAAVSLASAQDVAPDRYQTTFGTEEQAVKKTVSSDDDLQFALKLLKAAHATSTRSYRAQLYEKAYEFSGKKASGYKPAIEAIDYLIRAVPDRRDEWLDKKLRTMTQRYINSYGTGKAQIAQSYLDTMVAVAENKAQSGDAEVAQEIYRRAYALAVKTKSPLIAEIREAAAEVGEVAALEQKTAQFKRAFAAKPSLRNRENLIVHYIADLDSPTEAIKLISDDLDEQLAANVTLTATPVGTLTRDQCFPLARWCESLVKRPILPRGKLNAYKRARDCYNQFLTLADMTNSEESLAKIAVARLDKTIEKLDPRELSIDCGAGVKIVLRRMKKGKFMIGSPASESKRGTDEGPQTVIEITKTFYIGVTEVTRKQYNAVMGVKGEITAPNLPMTNVPQVNAKAFCQKLSLISSRTVRLPTEAEWEYACRAGSSTAFCFGNDPAGLDPYAWTIANSAVNKQAQPHAVRTKRANAWGLFDMHGNVREMVLQSYSSSSYAGADKIASQDPAVCRSTLHARGGSAGRDTSFCRSANRTPCPTTGDSLTGFRIVVEPKKAAPSLR